MTDYRKYFTVPLKDQQSKAFNALNSFIKSSNKIFILKGYAGTGKTTLMGGLIKLLEEMKIPFALLATTGRAAKILSNKTNNKAQTIHSHIYTFNELNEDLEKLSTLQNENIVDNKGQIRLMFNLKSIEATNEIVYVIDEASMVSDEIDAAGSFASFGSGDLLGDLLQFDKNGRYIFVGDPCQLPPINQSNSPALSREYLENKYNIHCQEYELTEIIRQDNESGIIKASFAIRRLYMTNPNLKFANLPLHGYPNISFHSSHISLLNHYIKEIKSNGHENATLICQTNKHCSELNTIVRNAIHGNTTRIAVGDLLMVTQNNYLTNLVNGDHIVVKAIANSELRAGLTFLKVEVQEMVTKIKYKLFLVENILYSTTTNLNSSQHKAIMIDFFKRMKDKSIHQNDLKFKETMLTDPYLNALKAVFGYALTCHKCQGGEWDKVYLYLDNKIHGIPKPQIYQWWYTAITRAKISLNVVNDWFIK